MLSRVRVNVSGKVVKTRNEPATVNVWFQKISIPLPWKVIGKVKVFKGKCEAKLKFIKEWVGVGWEAAVLKPKEPSVEGV